MSAACAHDCTRYLGEVPGPLAEDRLLVLQEAALVQEHADLKYWLVDG